MAFHLCSVLIKILAVSLIIWDKQGYVSCTKGAEYKVESSQFFAQDISVIPVERYRRQTNNNGTPSDTTISSGPSSTTAASATPDFSEFNFIHDDHLYYKSDLFSTSDINLFWVELNNVSGHQSLSNSHRRAATAQLPFSFPFYGHRISNVTIATGGFLYVSPFIHKFLTATQYIAPLMANFDTKTGGTRSTVLYTQIGSRFVVEWRDVHLQDQNTTSFSFQAILHNNGSIFFVYKSLPIPVQNISANAHPVKVGLSDAFYFDTVSFGTRRRTIYEYHRVSLNTENIREGSVVMIHPEPTCNVYSDCETCVSSNIRFDCRWCGIINRCSDSVDWHRQQWLDAGCVHLSGAANCSLIPTAVPPTVKKQEKGTQVAVIIVVVVILIALIGGIGGWIFYAYTHPTSASGMWLMEHRPSQMKAKLNNMKFWKRNTSSGDKYAVESTA